MPALHPAVAAPGSVTGGVRTTLRLEGALVLLACLLAYAQQDSAWGWFALAFFVPDVSLAAYAAGPVIGARLYNLAHSYALPLLLAGAALLGVVDPWVVSAALIWGAHVGFDRALGYGLKYGSAFTDTHLGRIGRRGTERVAAREGIGE